MIIQALDLGLNRAADNWQFNERKMFSDEENQERKQIWWACCIADKYVSLSDMMDSAQLLISRYSSTYMGSCTLNVCVWVTDITLSGRPICISENDFDTLLPDAEEVSCTSQEGQR